MSRGKAMSKATPENFELLVSEYYHRYKNALNLAGSAFNNEGYITTATMLAPSGRVEMRCGPSEYNAEIFIYTADGKRWSLADLIGIDRVRTWLQENRPSTSDRSRLDAEVDCAFGLLIEGLKGVDGFEWLHASVYEVRNL